MGERCSLILISSLLPHHLSSLNTLIKSSSSAWFIFLSVFFVASCGGRRDHSQDQDHNLKTRVDSVEKKRTRHYARVLRMTALNGDHDALSDHKGKPLILHVFTTWCRPCLNEVYRLNQLNREGKKKGYMVLGICAEGRGCPRLKDFQRLTKAEYPLRVGDLALTQGEGLFEKILGIPLTYLIDYKGRVIECFHGRIPLMYAMKEIVKLTKSSIPVNSTPSPSPTTSEENQ